MTDNNDNTERRWIPALTIGGDVYDEAARLTKERDLLRAALLAILDAVDYTDGACRVNDMVGAVLPKVLIERAREAVRR